MTYDRYWTSLYSVPFDKVTISTTASAWDLMTITGSTVGRTEIAKIKFQQLSTDVNIDQQIDLAVYTGVTPVSSGSGGGASITPVNLKGWPAAPTALTSATGLSSAVLSTSAATLIYADNTDWSGNWFYRPDKAEEVLLNYGQGLVVRISSPGRNVVLSGTMLVKEVGRLKS